MSGVVLAGAGDSVGAGLAGFLVFLAMIVAGVFLFRSLNARLRRLPPSYEQPPARPAGHEHPPAPPAGREQPPATDAEHHSTP